MNFMTILDASKKWGISPRRIEVLCVQGRIPGTTRFGKAWAIPSTATKRKRQTGRKNGLAKVGKPAD